MCSQRSSQTHCQAPQAQAQLRSNHEYRCKIIYS